MLTILHCLQANNVIVREWGTPREESELLNHVDLVQTLDIVDLDRGTAVAGKIVFHTQRELLQLALALNCKGGLRWFELASRRQRLLSQTGRSVP